MKAKNIAHTQSVYDVLILAVDEFARESLDNSDNSGVRMRVGRQQNQSQELAG